MNLWQEVTIRGLTLSVSYSIEGQDLAETETDAAEFSEPVIDQIKVFDSDEDLSSIISETVREEIAEIINRQWSER